MIPIDLLGRVAIVTGASGDLGRVMARTLARAGADVAVHYLGNKEKAESVAMDVRQFGRRAMIVQGDVTSLDSVLAMRDAIKSELGHIHVAVANAVIQTTWKSILDQTAEGFESQFRSCTMHLVNMAKAFAPAMIESKKGGRIVAINTECAMQCLPGQGAYASAKRAMDGIVRVLARELGKHEITVNGVAPGWMISDRDRATDKTEWPDYEKNVPMGHRGTDQEIANAVSFLASDLAKFITGAYIPVCGGNVMPGI
jgi:3-oxoacyl-[acyl-carrier protein] reductase